METGVDWNLVCLACLQEGKMYSIYEEDESGIKLHEKIYKCTSFDFSVEVNYPEQLCEECVSDLQTAFKFRSNCENSREVLRSIFLNDMHSKQENLKKESSGKMDSTLLLTPKKRYTKDAEREKAKVNIIKEEIPDDFDDNMPLSSVAVELDEDVFPNLTQFLKKKAKTKQKASSTSTETDCNNKTKSRNNIRPPKRYIESTENKKSKTDYSNNLDSSPILEHSIIDNIKKEKNQIEKPKSTQPIKLRKPRSIEGKVEKLEMLVCEICGNTYKHSNALRVHMLRHENVRQFKCELCPKAFVADTDLKRHMRVHTGEKPYACKYCDRKFSDFGSRGKHERTHTGERPYKCQRCNKSFTYSHVLNVHQLVHTGIKRFKCDVCNKGFTKKQYLDNHMKNHANCSALEGKTNTDSSEITTYKIANQDNNIDSVVTYEAEMGDDDLHESEQKNSVYTIVKTESGLAEVQYYLPIVE